MKISALLGLAVALCLGLPGCSHYQLGTGTAPRFATLHVAVVANEATVPQAVALVTTQVREAFIKDGRVRLVDSPASADAVLTLTLADYRREVTVVRPDDTALARRYDVILDARATLTDRRTSVALFTDRPLAVKRGVFTDSGQPQAEYQNLPPLAEALAASALHAVLDTW